MHKKTSNFEAFLLFKTWSVYFLPITFNTALQIALAFNPYFSINCSGVPDSPKVSWVATNSWGVGLLFANTLATLSPRPPKKLCSSAVTIHLVLETLFNMASSSSGLMVWILITSAEIPCSFNISAAFKASQTKCPVATIVTSFPSCSFIALPISKIYFLE